MVRQLPKLLKALPDWLSRHPTNDEEEHLANLPAGLYSGLVEKLQSLPTPEPYQDAIQLAARRAIQRWQANPETVSNCLVVLSRPIEAIAPMLKESLDNYLLDCDVRFILSAYHRPLDPLDITAHIRRELEPERSSRVEKPSAPVTQTEIHEKIPVVMIIPSLEECFVRCIQGWEGIEYFQTLSTQDTSRFWIFGCNHWAWAFLEKVCHVGAYLEQTVELPELSDNELQTWLAPLFPLTLPKQEDESLTVGIVPDSDTYWSNLESLSSGCAITAAYLWLRSLHIDPDDLTPEGTLPGNATNVELVPTKPGLPSLMKLTPMDRYLLHSLLIHGEMTRSHLALSLGEAERTVRSRLQVLHREGILLQHGRRLTVHPAYYPRLYSELSNNNFLIGKA